MRRLPPTAQRVRVQSFTYQNSVGSYRLRGWLSSTKIDDHVARMLRRGWKVLSSGELPGARGPIGPGDPRATITVIFGKLA